MRQNVKRRARNFPVRSELKTLVKKMYKFIKDGNIEEATKLMPLVFSIIDTAVKKKIIHQNNASRKKSRIAREFNAAQNGEKAAPVKEVKKEEKEA